MRPLVVLHVRATMKRLHADSTGKSLGAETGRGHCRRRGWSFTAQLTEKQHSQREEILDNTYLYVKVTVDSHLDLLQYTIRQC